MLRRERNVMYARLLGNEYLIAIEVITETESDQPSPHEKSIT